MNCVGVFNGLVFCGVYGGFQFEFVVVARYVCVVGLGSHLY